MEVVFKLDPEQIRHADVIHYSRTNPSFLIFFFSFLYLTYA